MVRSLADRTFQLSLVRRVVLRVRRLEALRKQLLPEGRLLRGPREARADSRSTPVEAKMRRRALNFGGLILGCIEAKFSK